MATPHDLYVRFLVTKGLESKTKINDQLRELNIGAVSDADFEKQFSLVEKTLPKGIFERMENQRGLDADFIKWMKVLEVDYFWYGEKPYLDIEKRRIITVITGCNDDPQLRLCINTLLIKGMKHADIAELMNLRFSCLLRDSHIELYQKYFFDPRRMTRKDWKSFLKDKAGKETSLYFTALTEPVEILKTDLELPTEISVAGPLQYLFTKSFLKAKQYLEVSGKEANTEARFWIDSCLRLAEKYEKYRSGDKTDFAKQLQMEFDFVSTDFPTPDETTLLEIMDAQTKKDA